MELRFSSPFYKGGSRGILKAYPEQENQNLPCPPLGKGGNMKHIGLATQPHRGRGAKGSTERRKTPRGAGSRKRGVRRSWEEKVSVREGIEPLARCAAFVLW